MHVHICTGVCVATCMGVIAACTGYIDSAIALWRQTLKIEQDNGVYVYAYICAYVCMYVCMYV